MAKRKKQPKGKVLRGAKKPLLPKGKGIIRPVDTLGPIDAKNIGSVELKGAFYAFEDIKNHLQKWQESIRIVIEIQREMQTNKSLVNSLKKEPILTLKSRGIPEDMAVKLLGADGQAALLGCGPMGGLGSLCECTFCTVDGTCVCTICTEFTICKCTFCTNGPTICHCTLFTCIFTGSGPFTTTPPPEEPSS